MSSNQPTLFDNPSFDIALSYMQELKFHEAISNFEEALKYTDNNEEIKQKINTCLYWDERLNSLTYQKYLDASKKLLNDFLNYEFDLLTAVFSNKILLQVAEKFCIWEDADLEDILKLTELLMKRNYYAQATTLVEKYLDLYENENSLYYYLAQSQYLDGHYKKANNNYIKALILQPEIDQLHRIENPALKECIEQFGMPLAPAYSLIKGVQSNAQINKNQIINDKQDKSLQAYQLILQAEQTPGYNTELRKQIAEVSPDLLKTYLKLQEKRVK